MKKRKAKKYVSDEQLLQEIEDGEVLPEETDEPFYNEEEEPMEDVTEELHEEDFTQFKKSRPSDWEG